MNCSNCARHVTEALQSVPGVAAAEVSLGEGRAAVKWKADGAGRLGDLLAAVKAAGYEAQPLAEEAEAHQHSDAGWRRSVILGVACTAPLMVGEWAFGLGMTRWFQWVAFGLALPVQVISGARFYRGAWRQLKTGGSNMDTLVALGSTAAFGYSVWALLAGQAGHSYFMEAAAIITLISVGHWMEARASVQAEKSLRALFALAPPTARRKNPDGSETEIPVAQVRAGEVLVLRPGDRAAADGKVQEGAGSFDEAMLTGESLPVEKAPGAEIYAGTINRNGHVLVTVTATGETTAMARIIAAVQRAQNSRADIQRLADRVSNVFVPIVVTVALAAGLWWALAPQAAARAHTALEHFLWMAPIPSSALIAAVAVLVVACPCAMGLATPIAIMAGANAGARRGILIRDGAALEKAGKLTCIVFDKTGTLTVGRPEVAEAKSLGEDARPLAAALARGSSHPLSQAIAKLSPETRPWQNWREIAGGGVEAQLDGVTMRLGSLTWLRAAGVEISGEGTVGLAVGSRLAGLFTLRDALKPGAADVVAQFRRQGLKVRMITGDQRAAALVIAAQLGLQPEEVSAGVRPEEKAGLVRQLQEQGERVAFVGDGINDAPALEQADLGVAVSRASDVAGEAADLVLLQSDIQAIPEAIALARATLRTIKQNLFWAFFYNAAAVPLAALGFLSPILCAATMGLSDLVVIGNALRLMRARQRVHPVLLPD
jgi:Cu+-exporting ATPase